MKTQEPNINGVTLSRITAMMHSSEKRIKWYNKKYNYGTTPMTAAHQKKYEAELSNWDNLKQKRDQLKTI